MSNKVYGGLKVAFGVLGVVCAGITIYEGAKVYKNTKASECECCDTDVDSENPADVEC